VEELESTHIFDSDEEEDIYAPTVDKSIEMLTHQAPPPTVADQLLEQILYSSPAIDEDSLPPFDDDDAAVPSNPDDISSTFRDGIVLGEEVPDTLKNSILQGDIYKTSVSFPFPSLHSLDMMVSCYGDRVKSIGEIKQVIALSNRRRPTEDQVNFDQLLKTIPRIPKPLIKLCYGEYTGKPFHLISPTSMLQLIVGRPDIAMKLKTRPLEVSNEISEMRHTTRWRSTPLFQTPQVRINGQSVFLGDFIRLKYESKDHFLKLKEITDHDEAPNGCILYGDLFDCSDIAAHSKVFELRAKIHRKPKRFVLKQLNGIDMSLLKVAIYDNNENKTIASTFDGMPIRRRLTRESSPKYHLINIYERGSIIRMANRSDVQLHRLAMKAAERDLDILVCPLQVFSDEAASVKSKRYSLIENVYMVLAGLPFAQQQQKEHINFVCASTEATPKDMIHAVVHDLKQLEDGIVTMHGLTGKDVLIVGGG
jgi:hypothetical protein